MSMKLLDTTRFGTVEIDEKRLVHFPEGLLGFPKRKNFIILEHKPDSPFCWLQSLDSPDLAFVLTNPFLIKKDYLENLSPEDEGYMPKRNGIKTVIFVLVTIPPGKAKKMTVNLMGPLFIDSGSRTGRQVIIANSGYSHRHPVIAN